MTEPRTRNLSFRLTESERQRIDRRADESGLETSEWARRAVLDVVTVLEGELEQAREEGRAEVRADVANLRAALTSMRHIEELLRRRAEELEAELKTLEAELEAAPEQLVEAIRQLLAGESDARMKVAELWARIPRQSDREELLPQLVAEVADGVEAIVGRFSTSGEAFARWPNCRQRVEWLIDALRPDVGDTVHRYSRNADGERIWKHVVDALNAADAARLRDADDSADT
jgi:chromosome segregation ATPase